MEKFINEFKEGDRVSIPLLITNVTKGVSNAGAPYLSLTLQDKSGTIEAKKWDVSEAEIAACQIGTVIIVNGDIIEYRGVIQMKVLSLAALDQNTVDYTRFCLASPIPQQELIRKLNSYLNSIRNEDALKIVRAIVERHYDAFVSYPAATRNHHEFASGLLYHTVSMCELADLLSSYYANVDRDLLLSGIILHDIGKTVELSGPIATKYTLEGKLIGHISIMVSEIRAEGERLNIHSEIPVLLQHMILSHHGEKDFGSPVPPLTREAFLLHVIDDLDAKMIIIDKALDPIQPGEFSQRIMAMDGRAFYKPKN